MIVADTGAVIALIDADDRYHRSWRALFEDDADAWILPWAILPEVDYLLATRVGTLAQEAFLADLAAGLYAVAWGENADLERAYAVGEQYKELGHIRWKPLDCACGIQFLGAPVPECLDRGPKVMCHVTHGNSYTWWATAPGRTWRRSTW